MIYDNPYYYHHLLLETGSPAFDEFLALLGQKVRMKGFTKYRAQLDHKGKYNAGAHTCSVIISLSLCQLIQRESTASTQSIGIQRSCSMSPRSYPSLPPTSNRYKLRRDVFHECCHVFLLYSC